LLHLVSNTILIVLFIFQLHYLSNVMCVISKLMLRCYVYQSLIFFHKFFWKWCSFFQKFISSHTISSLFIQLLDVYHVKARVYVSLINFSLKLLFQLSSPPPSQFLMQRMQIERNDSRLMDLSSWILMLSCSVKESRIGQNMT